MILALKMYNIYFRYFTIKEIAFIIQDLRVYIFPTEKI